VTPDPRINDAHCHFFSPPFFTALARQCGRTPAQSPADVCRELQWDDPATPDALADRWIAELDAHGVRRAALIASVPGDEDSVAAAVARHASRIVGFFMVDPSAADAPDRVRRGITDLGLRGVCLFPAMHHVGLGDERVTRLVEIAAAQAGVAVFVHCGVLSVGVRAKLGLPSRFDLRLGNPLDVSRLALAFPSVPFIVPHFGAGMLREALMAADACGNIHLDTSSSNSWVRYTPGLTLEAVFKTTVSVVGASRLLFGTDSSFFPRGWQRGVFDTQKTIVTEAGVSATDPALIFGGNFDRLFPGAR
jgi:predicted TIM-barrel fold metal-dependent hydrolase